MRVPLARPLIGNTEYRAVMSALKRKEISGTFGNYITRFEESFARYVDCVYGIATSNGTVALHLAIATLGIGKGDEVIVSTLTNMASIFAIYYTGATPIAIDIEPDTWNINPLLLESKITLRTKAIMVVHLYGHSVDMDAVMAIAKKYKLYVIEDCAEAHGALYKGKKVGSFGDIACYSFYANKIITTGEGGMLTCSNSSYAHRAKSLRSLAYGIHGDKFMHDDVGFNYRLSNLLAAIGCAQMRRIERAIALKRKIARYYIQELSQLPEIQLPVEKEYARNVYWMFHVVLVGRGRGKRKKITEWLKKKGIETREGFVPYNLQTIFLQKKMVNRCSCPVANYASENGFYLPSGPDLTKKELAYVTKALKAILQSKL